MAAGYSNAWASRTRIVALEFRPRGSTGFRSLRDFTRAFAIGKLSSAIPREVQWL
jgi:hypothetical protein